MEVKVSDQVRSKETRKDQDCMAEVLLLMEKENEWNKWDDREPSSNMESEVSVLPMAKLEPSEIA